MEARRLEYFFYFLFYSFVGFLLEIAFARITRSPRKQRKCFYLLPLCPVYGAGALALIALPAWIAGNLWLLFPCAVALATAIEYAFSLFYDLAFGVRFWDYSDRRFHVRGRICPLFSLAWGFFGILLLWGVQPRIAPLIQGVPAAIGIFLATVLLSDALYSAWRLRRYRTPAALRWKAFSGEPQRIQ